MSDKDKEAIISEISDEYKMAKMLGENPDIQEYLKRCPLEYIQELKGDIEDWEWLIGWKYEGSAEEISQYRLNSLIARIQPKLDMIEIKQLGKKYQGLMNKLRMKINMMETQQPGLATLDGSEELEEISVRIIDPSWQPTDEYETFRVTQPPVITADGKFILAVSTMDPKWNGCTLICKMKLALEDTITFETNIQQVSDNKWQAKIEVDGLPAPQMDVSVPLDILELYLYPSNQ